MKSTAALLGRYHLLLLLPPCSDADADANVDDDDDDDFVIFLTWRCRLFN